MSYIGSVTGSNNPIDKPMNRGGARKGAGRKATGAKTILVTFSLRRETAALLGKLERGKRSSFIDAAIRKAIEAIN